MAYRFGQFRSSQLTRSFLDNITYTFDTVVEVSPLSSQIRFSEQVIDIPNSLHSLTDDGTQQRCYYLKFRLYKRSTEQYVTVKLINTAASMAAKDATQTIKTFIVDIGSTGEYQDYELILAPTANYNRIEFLLGRMVDDYNTINEDGTNGRKLKIDVLQLAEIFNVVNILPIEEATRLKQIGVQSTPGLELCIDGEAIKVGRTGIYEINHGIYIKFVGFCVSDNDTRQFILDYQY